MTTDLVPAEQPAALTVYGTDEPGAIVRRVVEVAGPLADFIKQQGMSTTIQGREYVLAEGWAFMGSMLGVFPRTVRVSELMDPDGFPYGYEAQVELVTRDGSVVGGAIAECSRHENSWSNRDAYALKSMAQTRATGKAFRLAFGFVMKAAGYESTPAEEMPREEQGAQTVMPPQTRDRAPIGRVPNCPDHNQPMKEWGGRNGVERHWKCTAKVGQGYCDQTAPMTQTVPVEAR